jgi:hypothetical protein
MLVNDHAAAFIGDAIERELQLRAAVTAQAMKNVAGEALRVDSHQRRIASHHVAHVQNYGFFDAIRHMPCESKDPEGAIFGREIGFGYLFQPKGGTLHLAVVCLVLLL